MSFGEVQLMARSVSNVGSGYTYVQAADEYIGKAGRVIDISGSVVQRVSYGLRDLVFGQPTVSVKHARFCSYLENASKSFGSGAKSLERDLVSLERDYDFKKSRHLELVKSTAKDRKNICSLETLVSNCKEGLKVFPKEVVGTIDFTTLDIAKLEGTRDLCVVQSRLDLNFDCELEERAELTTYNERIAVVKSTLDYAVISRRRVDDMRTYAGLIVPTYDSIKDLGIKFRRMTAILNELKNSTNSIVENVESSQEVRILDEKRIQGWKK
ncbi:hypothetical protein HY483_01185 [Candidatus Woesearchaeota archaeon]|nr:hypothetical protein [Candidatus Woesearchaeota archaeon]